MNLDIYLILSAKSISNAKDLVLTMPNIKSHDDRHSYCQVGLGVRYRETLIIIRREL